MHHKRIHVKLRRRNGRRMLGGGDLFFYFLLTVAIWGLYPFMARAEPVILRTSVNPEKAWIGQRVILHIDVLGKDGWAQIPKIGTFDISGAYVLKMETQGTRLQETIGGEAYSGQRYELSIYPQRKGIIEVPKIPVDVAIKTWGYNAKETIQHTVAPGVAFRCSVPPGAEGIQGLVSAHRVTAEQQWQPDVRQVKVGETIQRSIQLHAENLSAMAFAPLVFPALDNTDVYPQTPTVKDQYTRGQLSGRRIERVTYFFNNAGSVELPAIVITWWDLENEKLRKKVLPSRAVTIQPDPNADGGDAGIPDKPATPINAWIYLVPFLAVLFSINWLFRKRLQPRWDTWRHRRRATEKAHFKRFVAAALSGDPARALNALMQWFDRMDPHSASAGLDKFLETFAEPHVAEEARHLIRAIDPEVQAPWNARVLTKGVADARRKWMLQQRKTRSTHQELPLLNP